MMTPSLLNQGQEVIQQNFTHAHTRLFVYVMALYRDHRMWLKLRSFYLRCTGYRDLDVTVDDKWVRIWKEVIVGYLKTLSRNLFAQENQEKSQKVGCFASFKLGVSPPRQYKSKVVPLL
jgi:hypothetical protein